MGAVAKARGGRFEGEAGRIGATEGASALWHTHRLALVSPAVVTDQSDPNQRFLDILAKERKLFSFVPDISSVDIGLYCLYKFLLDRCN